MDDLAVIDRFVSYVCLGGELRLDVDWRVANAGEITVARTRGAVTTVLVYGSGADFTIENLGEFRGCAVLLNTAALNGDEYDIEGLEPLPVTPDSELVYVLARWREEWLTGTGYLKGDGIHSPATGAAYVCILDHVSGAASLPESGVNWATYWDKVADRGVGVIAGGTTGQFLAKLSATDFDVGWVAGGESNTASNVGTGGVGVFKQKTAFNLEFKKINAGSAAITIADDTGNSEVDVDIAANGVTNAKFRQGAALSVVGVTGNATANVADIPGTADQVLRVNGSATVLGFGTVATGGITNSAVTYAKIQNVSATDRLLGRSTAGAGVVEEITCTAFARSILDDADAAAVRTTISAQTLDATLTALAAFNTNGLLTQTAADTFAGRTLTGTANEITATNGDGVAGNPTLSLPAALTFTGKTVTGGTFASPTAITGLPDPTSAQDAATKAYVDSVAAGLDVKASVKCATTANITLSGEQTLDGVTTSASRVLVKNQSTTANNGIYVSASGAWARATDMDNWLEVPGAFVFIEEGTTLADTGWVSTANAGGTLGSTSITWTQFSGAGTYTATGGVTLTGTQFSITTNGITNAMIRQSAGLSLVGRSANSTGDVADITAGSDFQVLRRSGTTIGFGAVDLSQAGAVTGDLAFANLAQGSARSVLGVTGNATADHASIQGAADQVLRVDTAGTALAFGTVATGGIAADAVTYAKMQNANANTVICRAAATSGDLGEVALAASQLFGRGASGDVAAIVLGTNLSMSGATLNATGGGGSVATDTLWDAKGDLAGGTGADTAARLPVGSNGQVLTADSAETTGMKWATVSGAGDVLKVGTPVNNQLGIWTGDGTIEGDAALTFDTATDTLAIAASGNLAFGAVTILADSAGTTTLSNIDALDATTEATIEAAIDTLASLTSIQGRTVTLADAGANAIFGWDDAAGAYENLTSAEATATLEVFTTVLKGLAPASGGGSTNFLRADGTWAAPVGGGDVTAAANFGTDNRMIRSDGTGKGVQASPVTVDDSGNTSGVGTLGCGAITSTGAFLLTQSASVTPWSVTSTNANSPIFVFESDDPAPAANDSVTLDFRLSDSAGTQTRFASLDIVATVVTDTAEKAEFRFYNINGGALQPSLVITEADIHPFTDNGMSIGTATRAWSGAHFNTSTALNWENGNYTLTHSSGLLTASGAFSIGTSNAFTCGTIELGAASDTTISRPSAGNMAVEGNIVYRAGGTDVAIGDGGTGASLADPGLDMLLGWDETTNAVKFMTNSDIATEAAPATGDFVVLMGAEGDVRKVDWSSLPGVGSGIANVVEDVTPQLGGDLDTNGFDILLDSGDRILLGAGTTGVAPITFTSGPSLTTAEAGAMEYDGTCLYGTVDAGNRGVVPCINFVATPVGNFTLASSTSEQALFTAANDTLTLETGLYHFDMLVHLSGMSATSGNAAIDILGAGTATLVRLHRHYGQDAALATVAAGSGSSDTAQTAASLVTAATGTVLSYMMTGSFRVTTAGTIIPSITLVTAAAATVNNNTYFRCFRIGSSTAVAVGQWT